MKILFVSLAFVLTLFYGCADSTTPSESLPSTPAGFVYSGGVGTVYVQHYVTTLTDTTGKDSVCMILESNNRIMDRAYTLPIGKATLYYDNFDTVFFPIVSHGVDASYLHTDSNSLFLYHDRSSTIGYRLIQFPLTVGTQFKLLDTAIESIGIRTIIAVGENVTVQAGTFKVVTFQSHDTVYHENNIWNDRYVTVSYAKGVMDVWSEVKDITHYPKGKTSTVMTKMELIAIHKP